MASAWLPRPDALLRAFATNLVQRLSASPAAYGLTAADVQPLASATGLFAATLASASDPATRTRGAVAGKRAAKVALLAVLRAVVRRVTSDPAVSPRQIVDLGLQVKKPRSPVPPPTTAPAVAVLDLARLGHTLRLTDGPATTTWAKPAGARAAEVYYCLGGLDAPPPIEASRWTFAGLATTSRTRVTYPATAAGKTAWVMARWVNAKGEPGPFGGAVRATVAA